MLKVVKRNRHEFSTLTIFGIESSCDDSCVSLLRYPKGEILLDERASQFHIHEPFKGIHPILAVREHEVNIPKLISHARQKLNQERLDLIAVTVGPGLKSCLNIGIQNALNLGKDLNVPVIGINHLEAHTLVGRLGQISQVPFPFITLLVSGGHTCIFLTNDVGNHVELGSTFDDAMGEAFDKVIRSLNQTNGGMKHGGAILEELAQKGKKNSSLKLPVPLSRLPKEGQYDFSFSGLKAATARIIEKNIHAPEDIAFEFQNVAIEHTMNVVQNCFNAYPSVSRLVVCGGVASNSLLRSRLNNLSQTLGISVLFPPKHLCVDNAVMVAWAGGERWSSAKTEMEKQQLMEVAKAGPRHRCPISELSL